MQNAMISDTESGKVIQSPNMRLAKYNYIRSRKQNTRLIKNHNIGPAKSKNTKLAKSNSKSGNVKLQNLKLP